MSEASPRKNNNRKERIERKEKFSRGGAENAEKNRRKVHRSVGAATCRPYAFPILRLRAE